MWWLWAACSMRWVVPVCVMLQMLTEAMGNLPVVVPDGPLPACPELFIFVDNSNMYGVPLPASIGWSCTDVVTALPPFLLACAPQPHWGPAVPLRQPHGGRGRRGAGAHHPRQVRRADSAGGGGSGVPSPVCGRRDARRRGSPLEAAGVQRQVGGPGGYACVGMCSWGRGAAPGVD